MTYHQRKRVMLRLAIVAFVGAAVFSLLFYYSLHATDMPLVLSLYHDANHDGQRQAGEPPAANFAYEWIWTDGTRQLSSAGMTDANGMIATSVYTGTWTLTGDALLWQLNVAGDVVSAGQQDIAVGSYGLWLPQVQR